MDKILLIDDHSMILNGLSTFFQNSSFEICGKLQSLKETEDFIKSYSNDESKTIALVDIELGNESGFDAIHLLKNAGIDAIVYTMYSSPSYVVKAMELGAKGYISKSSSEDELLQAVQSVLKGEVYIQQKLVPSLMYSANVFSSLTSKEKLIIDCVREHLDNNQIAAKLGITKRTVENHLSRIYDKFGVQNKHELEEKLL